jgi:hypothetical protein
VRTPPAIMVCLKPEKGEIGMGETPQTRVSILSRLTALVSSSTGPGIRQSHLHQGGTWKETRMKTQMSAHCQRMSLPFLCDIQACFDHVVDSTDDQAHPRPECTLSPSRTSTSILWYRHEFVLTALLTWRRMGFESESLESTLRRHIP